MAKKSASKKSAPKKAIAIVVMPKGMKMKGKVKGKC
jgi:hypothetical protein